MPAHARGENPATDPASALPTEAAEASDAARTEPSDTTPRTRSDALTRAAIRVAQGEPGAFESLDERLRPALARMYQARVGANRELAEDLAQRAMVGVWEALRAGRFDPTRASISTYTYAVAHRVWLVHARSAARTTHLGDAEADARGVGARASNSGAASASMPGAIADDADMAALLHAVRDCVSGEPVAGAGRAPDLSDEDRWLLAAIARGVTDRDLAKRLGIAPSSAHARKRAALAALKRALATLGFTPREPSD